MQLSRRKAYKACEPEDTVNLFKRVLKEKLGITFNEAYFIGDGEFYSCRISISNYGIEGLNIGTNGKGMTREYALASAYGEFMERLQNLILFSNRSLFYNTEIYDSDSEFARIIKERGLALTCNCAPDEETSIWTSSLRDRYQGVLDEAEIKYGDELYLGKKVSLLPYASITSNEVVKLPQQLIAANSTASGMCAGNTALEAIIQGLSEILERYILQRIYQENLSFPTIPDEWFEGSDILMKIKNVEKEKGIKFIIKDCSCGIGIPVIGVLILNTKALKYTFHLGADPSMITALERCVTETYQGFSEIQWLRIDWALQNRLLVDYQLKETECFKFRQNSTGHLPISIFRCNSDFPLSMPDNMWAISDENDFIKIIKIFKKLGRNVYIRDVSFLGVPSYQIYVPGISGLRSFEMIQNSQTAFYNRATLPDKTMSDEGLSAIVSMIMYDPFYHPTRYNLDDKWQNTEKDYQLAMLLYSLGEYDDSLLHMERSISGQSFSEHIQELYYHSIRNHIWNKAHGIQQTDDLIIYPSFLQMPVKSLMDKKGYMDSIPTCPDCEVCRIKNGCRIFNVFKLVKRIEKCYSENIPSQSLLAEKIRDII